MELQITERGARTMHTIDDCRKLLDEIRPDVLKLPVNHKCRLGYRSLRNGLINAAEESRSGGNTMLLTDEGVERHYQNIVALQERMNMDTTKLATQFFSDAAREEGEINEENLRGWLWFTCPANMRAAVERAIRADERWKTRGEEQDRCNCDTGHADHAA
jgi:hypothetical protein